MPHHATSRHQLLIASGVDTHAYAHTHTHTNTRIDIRTETILRDQSRAGRTPARAWFKNVVHKLHEYS